MVSLNLGHFYILNDTLTSVSSPVGGVSLDLEAEGALDLSDLEGLCIVKFSHAFDLDELDKVTFLIRVALIFVYGD